MTYCICLVKTTYAKRPCLLTKQPSYVYRWLTWHGGIPRPADRPPFSVIRLSLCSGLSVHRTQDDDTEVLRQIFYTYLALIDALAAGIKAACLVLARCVWSMFTESNVLTLPIFAFLLQEKTWLRGCPAGLCWVYCELVGLCSFSFIFQ